MCLRFASCCHYFIISMFLLFLLAADRIRLPAMKLTELYEGVFELKEAGLKLNVTRLNVTRWVPRLTQSVL